MQNQSAKKKVIGQIGLITIIGLYTYRPPPTQTFYHFQSTKEVEQFDIFDSKKYKHSLF